MRSARIVVPALAALVVCLVACGSSTEPGLDSAPPDGAVADQIQPDQAAADAPGPDAKIKPDAPIKPDAGPGPDAKIPPDLPTTKPDSTVTPPDLSPLSCSQLDKAFKLLLPTAKVCSPMLPVVQCTKLYQTELTCPCSTYVNPNNKTPLASMAALEAAWKAKSCPKGTGCPRCPTVSGASCQMAGGLGSCVDK